MRMIIHGFLIVFFSIMISPSIASTQIKTYDFEDLDSLQRIEQRNVVVFIHTDWCKYCQMMKQTTLKSKEVIQKLNSDFYFIIHDGEEKREITIQGKIFKYSPYGLNTGIHQLTKEFATLENVISYPTTCIINPLNEIIFQWNEFLGIKEFQTLLLTYELSK